MHGLSTTANRSSMKFVSIACERGKVKKSIFPQNRQFLTNSPATSISDAPQINMSRTLARERLCLHAIMVDQLLFVRELKRVPARRAPLGAHPPTKG